MFNIRRPFLYPRWHGLRRESPTNHTEQASSQNAILARSVEDSTIMYKNVILGHSPPVILGRA
jgi:hypothetical protein